MEEDKNMLVEAIKHTELIPEKQKLTLEVICLSEYPLSSKMIEKKLNTTKQRMDYSLKSLIKRKFIIREKDGYYVYRPNYIRMEELIKRYKSS
jgi:predicted transcriptional regulator